MSEVLDRLTRAIHLFASVVCIPAIAVIIVADVFCRYFLNAPIFWAQDVTTLILLLVFFGAQPMTYTDDFHIRMELLYGRFSRRMQQAVDVLSNLAIIFASGLIGYRMIGEMLDPYSRGDTHGFLNVPLTPFRLFVAIVMAVLICEALVRTIRILGDRK